MNAECLQLRLIHLQRLLVTLIVRKLSLILLIKQIQLRMAIAASA
jgi:hypothetical protein